MCRLPQPWFLGASLIKELNQLPSGYIPFNSHSSGGVLKNVGRFFSRGGTFLSCSGRLLRARTETKGRHSETLWGWRARQVYLGWAFFFKHSDQSIKGVLLQQFNDFDVTNESQGQVNSLPPIFSLLWILSNKHSCRDNYFRNWNLKWDVLSQRDSDC